jgi:hypothetical protein
MRVAVQRPSRHGPGTGDTASSIAISVIDRADQGLAAEDDRPDDDIEEGGPPRLAWHVTLGLFREGMTSAVSALAGTPPTMRWRTGHSRRRADPILARDDRPGAAVPPTGSTASITMGVTLQRPSHERPGTGDTASSIAIGVIDPVDQGPAPRGEEPEGRHR